MSVNVLEGILFMRVLYISRLNDLARDMYDYMCEQKIQVQVCDFSNNTIRKIVKFFKPEIIFISNDDIVTETFYFQLPSDIDGVPVLILCNEADTKRLKNAWTEFDLLVRPVNNETVINKMHEIIESESMIDLLFASYKQEYGSILGATQKNIMAIDDNPMVLRSIKTILEEDYNVLIAPNVEVAYKQLEKTRDIDLFILDYEMPEIDGVEAMQLFKNSKQYRDTPIIFLTGVTDKNKIIKAVAQNPAAYLLKPIDADKLKQTVAEVLEN